MASTQEFVDYVTEQLAPSGKLNARKMFGEYGLYLDGKFIGLICDNQFFLKKTAAGTILLGANAIEGFPYEGAKPAFLFDSLEDQEFLCELLRQTWQELTELKPK